MLEKQQMPTPGLRFALYCCLVTLSFYILNISILVLNLLNVCRKRQTPYSNLTVNGSRGGTYPLLRNGRSESDRDAPPPIPPKPRLSVTCENIFTPTVLCPIEGGHPRHLCHATLQTEMISTTTGNWIRSRRRRDRIQLPAVVEVIARSAKVAWKRWRGCPHSRWNTV